MFSENKAKAIEKFANMTEAEKSEYSFRSKQKYQHSGIVHLPAGKKFFELQESRQAILDKYNATSNSSKKVREDLLKEMFAECGENVYVEPPLNANFGGYHVHVGDNVYMNSNVTFVDDTHIYIGSYTMIGPNVVIATAGHPISPELRRQGMQFNAPVYVGENVWLGAGVTIMPGVKIGDNTVIGAGSVVTKDIPANVVAFGNPCRVYRDITDYDDKYYKISGEVKEIDQDVIAEELELIGY